jgi:predicted dehydrogenase
MRIGLVGCGRWGSHILRDLVTLGAAVTVVAENEATRERARAGGCSATVGGLEDLPRDLAGYVVATPTTTHGEMVERLLARGRPIFVEKPLAADLASARRIVERGGERVFVMEKWRYHPGIEALAALQRSGELGPALRVVMNRLQWGHNHRDTDAIWTLLPHDLAILQEILGGIPRPLAAVAERDPDGTVTGLTAFLGDAVEARLDLSIRRPRHLRSIDLVCRDGIATLVDAYADHIGIRRADGDPSVHLPPEERRPISKELPLFRELAAFVGHCGGGPPPKTTAADDLALVEAVVSLRQLAGLPD